MRSGKGEWGMAKGEMRNDMPVNEREERMRSGGKVECLGSEAWCPLPKTENRIKCRMVNVEW
jgi:hypothetical protein